jgi:NADPH-dependent 2,4-dienoyl-CoA reductase/sulfur reductase-like enzyme
MTRYVLLGTGAAGISAAEAIRSTDQNGEITFIGEDPHGYYSRPGLAYYLTIIFTAIPHTLIKS